MKPWRFLTCEGFTWLATDCLEERPSLAARLHIWLHLSWCRRCQAYLSQLKRTIETLGRLPGRPVAEEVRADLVRRFRESKPSASG